MKAYVNSVNDIMSYLIIEFDIILFQLLCFVFMLTKSSLNLNQ
jgi:hypothetical protein